MSISTAARFGGVSLAAALLFGPGIASADSPHFIGTPTASIDKDTGDLSVFWKEAGLGSTPVTYDLYIKTLDFTFQCFTKSNNKPQGSPNHGGESQALTSVTITPRNGQITGNPGITLSPQLPPPSTVACQGGGLQLCLTSVEYDGVTFEDEKNEVIGFGTEDEGTETSLAGLGPFTASASPFFPGSCSSSK